MGNRRPSIPPALSVFVFIQGKEPAEDGSGFGIGQVDMAQIPKSRAHVQALEMVIAGGDLKADTLQSDGAVRADPPDGSGTKSLRLQFSHLKTESKNPRGTNSLGV
jgi:hypothetical protein